MNQNSTVKCKTRLLVCFVILSGLFLSACSTTDPKNYYPAAKSNEIQKLNQKIFASARVNTDPSDYVLGPGDLLEIKVFETEDLSTTVRVSSRGFVTLPLLGQVDVKSLSAQETEKKIEDLYKEDYLQNPHVSVFVKEHISQRITLVGEFKNPGTYDYFTKMRLLGVMALGGGLSEKAGTTVQIRRVTEEEPIESKVLVVDLDQLIREGPSGLNIEIQGSDVVFVPEAGTFLVEGAVREPGAYPINQSLNVREAIGVAGGFMPYALKDRITLIRYSGGDKPEIREIDFDSDDYAGIELRNGDVLLAESSGWSKFVHGAGINIGAPWLGVGYRNPEK